MGLAIGDALGGPTEGKSRADIVAKWGRVTGFLSAQQEGTDDTEYALFTAKLIFLYGKQLTPDEVAATWLRMIVSETNEYKGAGFSEMLTIANLKAGLTPPASGQHLHGWSDGLAMRVAPLGIVAAGNPRLAAELAETTGTVSHCGEGIFAGKAVASAVSVAMTGASIQQVIDAALQFIPNDSWTAWNIREAVNIGEQSPDVWEALNPLYEQIVCLPYYWADLAPEAVGLSFGILAAAKDDFQESVLGAVNVGRDTDTIAAIVGAINGARYGIQQIPGKWLNQMSEAKGICIRAVKGMKILDVADSLSKIAIEWSFAK